MKIHEHVTVEEATKLYVRYGDTKELRMAIRLAALQNAIFKLTEAIVEFNEAFPLIGFKLTPEEQSTADELIRKARLAQSGSHLPSADEPNTTKQ